MTFAEKYKATAPARTNERIPKAIASRGSIRCALLACALATSSLLSPCAQAQSSSDTLSRLMKAQPEAKTVRLSPVREAALKASAQAVGTQTGLIERSREIKKEIDARHAEFEKSYRFGDFVMGAGVLPPVIVSTENAATVNNDTMRLAGAIYQIRQPARFFSGAPSWRDWLLLGMPVEEEMPSIPTLEQLLPRDEHERIFWEQQVKEAYFSGRQQAQEIFENNLSMLEETYVGMRTFYKLYQRKILSAPIIAKSQEIVTQDDPNTIVVGDTLFRITMPSEFNTNPSKWRPLEANPDTERAMPKVPPATMNKAASAYAVQQEKIARQQVEALARKMGVTAQVEVAPMSDTQLAQAGKTSDWTSPAPLVAAIPATDSAPAIPAGAQASAQPVKEGTVLMERIKLEIDAAGQITATTAQGTTPVTATTATATAAATTTAAAGGKTGTATTPAQSPPAFVNPAPLFAQPTGN